MKIENILYTFPVVFMYCRLSPWIVIIWYTTNMIVKGLYTILLGIFLTLFVSIGIATFYPEPIYQPPAPCMVPLPAKTTSSGIGTQEMNKNCERAQKKISDERDGYVQFISSVALIAAVVYLVLSITVVSHMEVFSYGFLFGSIFTLLYSVMRGLGSSHAQFKFVLVCLSLGVVLWVGYLRFIKEQVKK